jgi:hypothetical protein
MTPAEKDKKLNAYFAAGKATEMCDINEAGERVDAHIWDPITEADNLATVRASEDTLMRGIIAEALAMNPDYPYVWDRQTRSVMHKDSQTLKDPNRGR